MQNITHICYKIFKEAYMYKRNDLLGIITFSVSIFMFSMISFAGILCEYIHHTGTTLRIA